VTTIIILKAEYSFFDGVRVRAWSEIDEKYSDKTTTTIREIQTRDLKFGGCLGSKADVI
jgi:hypothetical protein